jgi:low temperature requirement protein LtrA
MDSGDEAELEEFDELEEELEEEEAGRHATNLELFLDLAFVFAVSQLSRLIASHLSAAGAAKSALVAWIVWSLWSQFAWLGTAIDLDRDAPTRLAFISSVLPAVFLAIGIPHAYGDDGRLFGLAVLAGTVWVLALQGMGLWGDPHTRGPFIGYASLAGIAPVLIAIGGFLGETARISFWIAAAVIGIAGTFTANRQNGDAQTSWRIDPVHFAERHGLFVIIVLGEVLVAIGVAATEQDMTGEVAAAVLASVALASVLWWAYFGVISRFGEHGLSAGHGVERARLARDFFTFWHFPLVLGVAFLASVVEHVVSHPGGHLHDDQLWLLGTAFGLVALAFVGQKWRLRRAIVPEWPVAALVVGALLVMVGPHASGTVLLAGIAAVLAVVQAITLVRVGRDA